MTDEGMNKLKDLRKEYEFLAKYNGGEDYIAFKVLDMAVKELSHSENPNKWIPVSERLPEKEGKYLTTIFNGIRYIMTCDYHPYSRCWFPDDECASDNVIAWMPLPEPYEPQESEE